jgi:hypothetical protein
VILFLREPLNRFIKEYPESSFARFAQYRVDYLKRLERLNNALTIAEIVKKKEMKKNRTCFNNFGDSLTSLFGRSGIKVFVAGTVESGAWIKLECNSYALGNDYCPDVPFPKKKDCKFLYTGAKISGKFIYQDTDQSIEKAFKGIDAVDSLRVIKSNNMTFEQPESASEAPFEKAYPKKEIDWKNHQKKILNNDCIDIVRLQSGASRFEPGSIHR